MSVIFVKRVRTAAMWLAYRAGVTNGAYARYWTQCKLREGGR